MAKINITDRRCKRCGAHHVSTPPSGLCSACDKKWQVVNDPNDPRVGQVVAR